MSAPTTHHLERPPRLLSTYGRVLFSRKPGLAAGQTIPRLEVALSAVHIDNKQLERYRAACRFVGRGVPITFPQVLAAPLHLAVLSNPHFPLPALGLVHVSNRIVQHRELDVAAPLSIRCHLEGHREVPRGREFDVHTAIHNGDELVWESVTTVLSMVKREKSAKKKPAKHRERGVDHGQSRSIVWTLPADTGRRYAAVSGDYNPIHLYPITAKLFGFRRPIAHGMWTAARCAAELQDDVPGSAKVLDVVFKKPLLLPGRALFSSSRTKDGATFILAKADASRVFLEGSLRHVDP